MSRSIVKNFRGLRAVVLQYETTGRDTLLQTLEKLGLEARAVRPEESAAEAAAEAELIFVDADEGIEPIFRKEELPGIPLIAIVGSEAPSRLARVVQARAASHIQKPVRSAGVFTAVLLAMNEHAQRCRLDSETAGLRRRLAGRRLVVKAVITLMTRWGIDDEDAYERLRQDAMNRRVPVEDVARDLLGLGPEETSPEHKHRFSE